MGLGISLLGDVKLRCGKLLGFCYSTVQRELRDWSMCMFSVYWLLNVWCLSFAVFQDILFSPPADVWCANPLPES